MASWHNSWQLQITQESNTIQWFAHHTAKTIQKGENKFAKESKQISLYNLNRNDRFLILFRFILGSTFRI